MSGLRLLLDQVSERQEVGAAAGDPRDLFELGERVARARDEFKARFPVAYTYPTQVAHDAYQGTLNVIRPLVGLIDNLAARAELEGYAGRVQSLGRGILAAWDRELGSPSPSKYREIIDNATKNKHPQVHFPDDKFKAAVLVVLDACVNAVGHLAALEIQRSLFGIDGQSGLYQVLDGINTVLRAVGRGVVEAAKTVVNSVFPLNYLLWIVGGVAAIVIVPRLLEKRGR